MSNVNEFLPFCNTDTGLNLETQVAYTTDPQRSIGNQPGIAKSKLVNKAARQASALTSQIAQFISDTLAQDVLDDGNLPTLLTQIQNTFGSTVPTFQKFLAGAGVYTTPVGVKYLKITMLGGGGGGASGNGAGAGNNGVATTFGAALLSAGGGGGGAAQAATANGGTFTVNAPALDFESVNGAPGSGGGIANGGDGGDLSLGGGGGGGAGPFSTFAGIAAATNSGSGGGGGGDNASLLGGPGGGSGATVVATINNPAATYTYSVGTFGTGGGNGANGGAGRILVEEFY